VGEDEIRSTERRNGQTLYIAHLLPNANPLLSTGRHPGHSQPYVKLAQNRVEFFVLVPLFIPQLCNKLGEQTGDSNARLSPDSETNFNPRAGSKTRLKVVAQRPQSQKCTVSLNGFSSNGADDSSLAASEIDTTSN